MLFSDYLAGVAAHLRSALPLSIDVRRVDGAVSTKDEGGIVVTRPTVLVTCLGGAAEDLGGDELVLRAQLACLCFAKAPTGLVTRGDAAANLAALVYQHVFAVRPPGALGRPEQLTLRNEHVESADRKQAASIWTVTWAQNIDVNVAEPGVWLPLLSISTEFSEGGTDVEDVHLG
jgi:hypothetical protein